MKLKIHNDAKEKPQSFEAYIDGGGSLDLLIGYGENKDEAISMLKPQIEKLITELQHIDFDSFDWVDCFGETIKKD